MTGACSTDHTNSQGQNGQPGSTGHSHCPPGCQSRRQPHRTILKCHDDKPAMATTNQSSTDSQGCDTQLDYGPSRYRRARPDRRASSNLQHPRPAQRVPQHRRPPTSPLRQATRSNTPRPQMDTSASWFLSLQPQTSPNNYRRSLNVVLVQRQPASKYILITWS